MRNLIIGTKTVLRALSSPRNFRSVLRFFRDYLALQRQMRSTTPFPFGKLYPQLRDWYVQGGTASGHYFHQDLLVARYVFENQPQRHVDIGSRIDGFVAHVAAFRQIEVLDIRPLEVNHPTIVFKQADLMQANFPLTDYCDSVSCLHALEHFGLGRYGDNIDIDGHLRGLKNITQMLTPGGKFYLSVPIGLQRIEFNAHRIFSVKYLLSLLEGFSVDRLAYVDDAGNLHVDVALDDPAIDANFGCRYGCGIFQLTKRKVPLGVLELGLLSSEFG